MPYKVWAVNEILTAADMNTYVGDQTILSFAGTAARATAIGTPVEGIFSYLQDSDQLEVYSGTANGWVSASNVLFGTAVPSDGQVVTYSSAVSGYVPATTASVSAPGDNLLYNGAMQVAQRGASETGITADGYYTADRWRVGNTTLGTWTQTIEADGPTGSGFTKSMKMECTTADAAPAAGDFIFWGQRLEGQDLQGLKKGTSDAESLTLSFWVKSNVTGTYIVELSDNDNSRQISQAYTVSSSGTWEKKTLTFAGDTTGALDNDNATSLIARWFLGAGSDRTSGTLNTSWNSVTNANRAVGQTNLAAATSNYWQITGVQLEAGQVATSFEHKPYGVELAECQRYYYHLDSSGAAGAVFAMGRFLFANVSDFMLHFPHQLRTTPSLIASGSVRVREGTVEKGTALATLVASGINEKFARFQSTVSSATPGFVASYEANSTTSAVLAFDAEL